MQCIFKIVNAFDLTSLVEALTNYVNWFVEREYLRGSLASNKATFKDVIVEAVVATDASTSVLSNSLIARELVF